MPLVLTPEQLRELLDAGGATVLDVREPAEWEICRLPGAIHIPLAQLEQRIGELDRSRQVVIVCHHGMRSERAARLLARNGFDQITYLAGGLDAWAQTIDPAMPRY